MDAPTHAAREDAPLPPGTVRLFGEYGQRETTKVVLQPIPSEDPNDPLNWTTMRKCINFVPVLAITAIIFTQFSISVVFWQFLTTDLNATMEELNIGQAIGLAGTATGCIFFIPIAIKYGRRPIYIISIVLMTAMAFWQACMRNTIELYVTSLVQGLAGATNESIVQMTIADIFFVHQRGTANGLYMIAVVVGSLISPIIAGHMADSGNWRQCFWVLGGLDVLMLVIFSLWYEESKYVVRTKPHMHDITLPGIPSSRTTTNTKDDYQGSDDMVDVPISNHKSYINRNIPVYTWKQKLRLFTPTDENLFKLAYRPFVILFRLPSVMYTALQYGFGLAWVSAFVSIISMVFPYDPYNFSPSQVGNMILGPFIGCIIGTVYGGIISDRVILYLARRNGGYYEPEMRLHLIHLPAICLCAGLITFGCTVGRGMYWLYPSIGGAIFGFGFGAIADIALSFLIDTYKGITGEGFVAVAFVRNVFSILIFFVVVPWKDSQGVQNMFIVLGIIALLIACLHIPLIFRGKHYRIKTADFYWKLAKEKENMNARI